MNMKSLPRSTIIPILILSCFLTEIDFAYCFAFPQGHCSGGGKSPSIMTMKTTGLSMKFFDTLEDMLFPSSEKEQDDIDPTKELATFSFSMESHDDMDMAQSSLEHFLNEWAFQLAKDSSPSSSSSQSGRKNGLSTPISAGQFQDIQNTRRSQVSMPEDLAVTRNNDNDDNIATVVVERRLRIMFRPPPRYLSYNEQKNMEKGVLPDRKGAKLDSKSPGGVDLLVTYQVKQQQEEEENEFAIALVVKRCCFDSDTILKESSERAIIRRLNEAMRIWQKVRAMKV